MSTHKVQETEAHPLADHVGTQEAIKTTTGTTTPETLSSPRRVRPLLLTAVAVTAFAAAALTPWLVTTNTQSETGPVISTSPAASPQQAAPAQGQASAASNTARIGGPTAYVMFCQNSPSLCAPATPVADIGYLRFCWNSPTLCTVSKRN